MLNILETVQDRDSCDGNTNSNLCPIQWCNVKSPSETWQNFQWHGELHGLCNSWVSHFI